MQTPEKYLRMAETMQMVSTELHGESERGCVVLAFVWMDAQQLLADLSQFSTGLSAKIDVRVERRTA